MIFQRRRLWLWLAVCLTAGAAAGQEPAALTEAAGAARYRLADAPLVVVRVPSGAALKRLAADSVAGGFLADALAAAGAVRRLREPWEAMPVLGRKPPAQWLPAFDHPRVGQAQWLVLPGRDFTVPKAVLTLELLTRDGADPAQPLAVEFADLRALLEDAGAVVWRPWTAEPEFRRDPGIPPERAGLVAGHVYVTDDPDGLAAMLDGDTAHWPRRLREAPWRADLAEFWTRPLRTPMPPRTDTAVPFVEDFDPAGDERVALAAWVNTARLTAAWTALSPNTLPVWARDWAGAGRWPTSARAYFAPVAEGRLRYRLDFRFPEPMFPDTPPRGREATETPRIWGMLTAFAAPENDALYEGKRGASALRAVVAPAGGLARRAGDDWWATLTRRLLQDLAPDRADWLWAETGRQLAAVRGLTGLHPDTAPLTYWTGEVGVTVARLPAVPPVIVSPHQKKSPLPPEGRGNFVGDKGDVGEEINPPPAWCVVFPVSDAAAAEAGWRRMVDWLQWRDRALGHDAHWVRRRWWRPGLITASDVTPKMRETLPGYPVDVRMNGADEHATPLQAVAVVREGIPSTARHGWVVVTNRLDRIGTVLGASNASGRPPVAYIHAIETPAVRASRPQPDGGWTPVFAWDAGLTPDDRAAAVRYLLTDRRRKRGAPAAVATDDNATYGELFWRDVLERVGGLLLADENGLVATRPDTLTIRGEGQGGALLLTGAAVWTADAFRALAPRAPDHAARRLRTLTALAWAHKNADLGATGDFPPTLAALLHVRAEDGSLLLHNYYTRFERLDEPQPLAQWLTRAAHGQELDGYWFTMRSEDSSDHSWLFSASPLPPAGSPADTPVTRREAWERAKKHDWPIFRIAEDGSIASQPIPDD